MGHLVNELLNLKKRGIIKNIGVSLYEPAELEYLLLNHNNDIDIVQIPFNLLDSRWVENNLLRRTKEKKIKIFARSVFLQGLIFIENKNEMDKIDYSLKSYISKINNIASNKKISIGQLAMDYVKLFNEINGILVGCETINQLKENIFLFNKKTSLDKNFQKQINAITNNISTKIIDPREW
ncbi:MAG: aldo/keto reductase [Methanobacteriaceae archaeon]|nr:aldo/keto reductase [Methanobacteriaceae archaeon]